MNIDQTNISQDQNIDPIDEHPEEAVQETIQEAVSEQQPEAEMPQSLEPQAKPGQHSSPEPQRARCKKPPKPEP
ncbi:MAG TPA: hypothetical protein PKI71_15220, partial [Candidatus Rifleibacterium sp.]|nr:hypothetical protein [Candidatus Rifleibacterium sp.]